MEGKRGFHTWLMSTKALVGQQALIARSSKASFFTAKAPFHSGAPLTLKMLLLGLRRCSPAPRLRRTSSW